MTEIDNRIKPLMLRFLELNYPVKRLKYELYSNKRNPFRRVIVTEDKTFALNTPSEMLELELFLAKNLAMIFDKQYNICLPLVKTFLGRP